MTKGRVAGDRVNLSVIAGMVRDSMAPYANSLGVTLSSHEEADSSAGFAVIGSEAALRRALTSLVDNALSHEHQGGTVELRVRRVGSQVSAAVSDDGIGIDPETMATLFTRFSHGSEHTAHHGRMPYGIGLALVREIAQAHGGEIAVESIQDKGTTFTLTLPAAAGDKSFRGTRDVN
jgi:signal transduction histidine kinase